MDNSMFLVMDLLMIGFGAYLLYGYYLLKVKGEAKENLILSQDVKWNKCKDKPGYINYMSPRVLITGIVTMLCGAIGAANNYWNLLGMGYLAVVVIFLAVIVWFCISIKKSVKLFW